MRVASQAYRTHAKVLQDLLVYYFCGFCPRKYVRLRFCAMAACGIRGCGAHRCGSSTDLVSISGSGEAGKKPITQGCILNVLGYLFQRLLGQLTEVNGVNGARRYDLEGFLALVTDKLRT